MPRCAASGMRFDQSERSAGRTLRSFDAGIKTGGTFARMQYIRIWCFAPDAHILPNVKDEPHGRLARSVLLGARSVTDGRVGSSDLLGWFCSWYTMLAASNLIHSSDYVAPRITPRINFVKDGKNLIELLRVEICHIASVKDWIPNVLIKGFH